MLRQLVGLFQRLSGDFTENSLAVVGQIAKIIAVGVVASWP
jgi:hypothetical protein